MKLTNVLRSLTALVLCIALSGIAHASSQTVKNLEGDIKSYQTQKTSLKQELEFTLFKLKATQEKLSSLQRDLKIKEIQHAKMKAALGQSPSPEQQEFISNENKRMNLSSTAIKSRKAAIARLERKQRNIQKKTTRIDKLVSKTKRNIASIKKNTKTNKQAASSAKAHRMRRELEELKKENEQLRIAMAEEAKRVRSANEDNRRLEKIAQEKELALKESRAQAALKESLAQAALKESQAQAALKKKALAKAKRRGKAAINQDQSQIVLPGEKPIYKKSDGRKVVIRNRGKRKSSMMVPIGDRIYQAEVELEPGKSYFDVKKRRYRGYFPEKDGKAIYLFTYNLQDKRHPKLSVKKKEDKPNQMISNANDPF